MPWVWKTIRGGKGVTKSFMLSTLKINIIFKALNKIFNMCLYRF